MSSTGGNGEGNTGGGDSGENDGDNSNDNSNWFSSIVDFLGNILNSIINLPKNFIEGIGNFFNILNDGVKTIVDYLNPFSENFFVYKLIELLGNLLKGLFIPNENYFSDIKESLLSDLKSKLPYENYIGMFGSISDISTNGEISDIAINNYQVGDLNLNVSNFIDFSFITKYRDTWYSWVRGFMFIFLIIYHVNQLTKFLRGFSITDGAISHYESSRSDKK